MIRGLIASIAAAGAISGVAIVAAPAAGAEPEDKYTQTWTKPYGETTCLEYRTVMIGSQTWAMAADMLTNVRNMDENTGLPPDYMVSDFARQMQTACVPGITDTESMADVGTAVFMLDGMLKSPHFQV